MVEKTGEIDEILVVDGDGECVEGVYAGMEVGVAVGGLDRPSPVQEVVAG